MADNNYKDALFAKWLEETDGSSAAVVAISNKNHTLPLLWTFYTNCCELLAKLQSTLAGSDYLTTHFYEEVRGLKDEVIRLRLWGEGYYGETMENILEDSEELKVAAITMLIGIAAVSTDRESIISASNKNHIDD
jgi:hypothetical protein